MIIIENILLIGAIAFIVFLYVMYIYTLIHTYKKLKIISQYKGNTTAIIVGYEHKVVWNRTTKTNIYSPIYEYEINNHKYKKMYPLSTSSWFEKNMPTGEHVEIFYDENDPGQFAPVGSKEDIKKTCNIIVVILIVQTIFFVLIFT